MPFKIPTGDVCAIDLETTGLFPQKGDQFYCASFCNEVGESAVISFPVNHYTRKVDYAADKNSFEKIKRWAENPAITKVNHNISFDIRFLEKEGIKVKGPIVCTMNLVRLVQSDAPMALKPFCEKYLGIDIGDEKELKEATRKARREGKAKNYAIYQGAGTEDGSLAPDYWLAPRELVEKYAITDAQRAMAVYTTLYPEIRKEGMDKLWDQEQKTWKILRKIEKRGIRVFPEKIKQTVVSLKKKLLTYQAEAHTIVGQKINLNSSLQLRKIFYEKLNESQKFLTKAGYPSTDVDALRGMKHPLSKIILNIRACNKTLEFMAQYENFMRRHKDGYHYIHPTIHQAMTVTGRESCRDPNLQQVAAGRNDKGIEVLVEARSVFGPRPGYQMRSYDWKNIEVFIPAFASGEQKLIKVLKEGGDVHQNTADSLTQMVGQMVDRDRAKRIFFGLLYGIGSKKLAKLLSLEENLAVYIVHGFKKEYPTLVEWMEGLKYEALTKGFINTQYGRRIQVSNEEYYKAPNYFVQGTAGGILRSAKIKIAEKFKALEMDAHIVLPIHDELLIEMNTLFPEKYDGIIVRCMQDNPELKMPIPIPVSISAIGEHWADKKKVKTI